MNEQEGVSCSRVNLLTVKLFTALFLCIQQCHYACFAFLCIVCVSTCVNMCGQACVSFSLCLGKYIGMYLHGFPFPCRSQWWVVSVNWLSRGWSTTRSMCLQWRPTAAREPCWAMPSDRAQGPCWPPFLCLRSPPGHSWHRYTLDTNTRWDL